jgi:ABC-type branched-subunit amino acid transport system ATPase component
MENLLVARPKQRGETLLGAFFRAGVGLQEADNEKIALDLLRSVGLEGKASRPVEQLSYGEQKVISLLCCLAAEANVLLLDEPFSGIHPELAVQIQKLLEAISSEDRLIVFIEHDIGVVRQIAHHVIVMDEGRVVAEGSPGNVLDRPDILEAYLG